MRRKSHAFFSRPLLLFAASSALLITSAVGSARAALTHYSENYEMQFEVPGIGVSLLENDQVVSSRNYVNHEWQGKNGELLTAMLRSGEKLTPGRKYPETLKVENTGAIDSYVRVILYRNWTKDGESADTELSPELIKLNLTGGNWVEDASASTRERTILYYTKVVPGGSATDPLCDALWLDASVGTKMTETRSAAQGGTVITTKHTYNGCRFHLKAEVDAVQTHNAVEAIKSAWGVDVRIGENGELSL